MDKTYLVGHMKDEDFVPCDISTDMREPQMHGVYVNLEKGFVIEVVGVFENDTVMTGGLENDKEVEAVTHLGNSLREEEE